MADVFISYSRKNSEFVQKVHDALTNRGKDVWVDWEDIPAAAKWRVEISEAIEGSDTILFVISPDSVVSAECAQELSHAWEHHKRLIAMVYKDVQPTIIPKAVSELNYIFCRDCDNFEKQIDTLVTAIETDLEWVKAHTRLLTRAVDWDRKNRDNSLLVRGSDLRSAEEWMALSGTKQPTPTALQGQFILASRQDATARQRRRLIILVTVLIAVATLSAIAIWQYVVAQKREEVALAAFYSLTYDLRENLKEYAGLRPVRKKFIEGNLEGLTNLSQVGPDTKVSRELATNYRALAEVLWEDKELDKAAQAYRKSNEITQRLVTSDPNDSLLWRDIAVGHFNLSLIAQVQTKSAEALDELNQALGPAQQAAHLNPSWNPLAAEISAKLDNIRRTLKPSVP